MAVFDHNLALSNRRSMLSLEYAEYNSGEPLSIELDCGCITDAEMDHNQPLMCAEYTKGEHVDPDWDCIDDEALASESDYKFLSGLMITR